MHLANDPGCKCGCAFEDAIHYILECCLYEAREELKLRLVFLNELKIEVLRFGDDTLNEMQNLQIFKSNEQNVLPMYDHNTPPHPPPPKYIFD